jgi:hypothetical protein
MTQNPDDALTRLTETLAEENAALEALDFVAATRLLPAKTAALAAVEAIRHQTPPLAAPSRPAATALRAAVLENRRLLERALMVQGRVLGTIARAAARGRTPTYGREGTAIAPRQLPAVALSARC